MIILVINHWGGIPAALMRRVGCEGDTPETWVKLSRTTPVESFSRSIKTGGQHTVFHIAQSHGFDTVLLGPTGLSHEAHPHRRFLEDDIPDPTESLKNLGVNRCSLHDGAFFRGRASVYDENTLREAERIVSETDDTRDLFLWINLLSCRDVPRARFRATTEKISVDSFSIKEATSFDRRLVPSSVTRSIPTFTEASVNLENKAFGEAISARRRPEAEYVALLSKSENILVRASSHMSLIICEVRARGGSVACTATHATVIGEYGMRCGNAPVGQCCRVLWKSELNLPDCDMLHQKINDFVCASVGRNYHPHMGASPTYGKVGSHVFARVECVIRERNYSITFVGSPPTIFAVHDVDSDPEEVVNIIEETKHIHPEFYKEFYGQHEIDPLMKLAEIEDPPAKKEEPQQQAQAASVPKKKVSPPASTPVARPPKSTASLRAKENRLDRFHR
jgi:hypothetical protein